MISRGCAAISGTWAARLSPIVDSCSETADEMASLFEATTPAVTVVMPIPTPTVIYMCGEVGMHVGVATP